MDSFPLGNLCRWPAAVVMLALAACTTVGPDEIAQLADVLTEAITALPEPVSP